MTLHIEKVDPRANPAWDEFVARHPGATVFHTSAWCRVLADTYGYKPAYLVSREYGTFIAGIPLMLIDPLLTSRRLVGLPFSDVCGPLLAGDRDQELLAAVLDEVTDSRAAGVQLRGPCGDMPVYSNGTNFYQHVISLEGDFFEANVHNSARRAIRKAEKQGVTVRASTDLADMRRFFDLMVLTRRKHGLLPQPWRFYVNLHRHLIAEGHGYLLLADYQGQTIAGDLILQFRDQLTYKFNASDPRFLDVRPNNLLLWRAMHLGAEAGHRSLDLGRCELDNEGLRRFKLLWGAREERIGYYHYPSNPGGTALLQARPARLALSLFVRHAPAFALQAAGGLLYGNFG
jgi:CelD/BcsL family acetyltransferase involved in cellulose biosynthesis